MSSQGSVPPQIPFSTRPQSTFDYGMSGTTKINAAYYPNYRVYRGETPASLNFSCISHVFYAFAHVSPGGAVLLSDEWADLQMPVDGCTGCLGSFISLKRRHPHLKLILSIGGGAASQNFAAVASDTVLRDNFARSAKDLVEASDFDGIDIDWEHPCNPQQGQDFLTLLATIRLYLADDRYLLTAALPAGQWALQNIDLYKAQDYLDLINLMAYDFTGPWSTTSGHQAQLYAERPDQPSGSAAVDYVISTGFPAAKILLGIPVYGRSFLGATAPYQQYQGHGGEDGVFEYKALPRHNTIEVVNTRAVAASCSGGDGGFVSYDNPETVTMKASYCKEKGLGGLFYWTATADVEPGPRSLISAGFRALHSA